MVRYPSDWKISTVKDFTKAVITGGTPSTVRQDYYGGNIPWLSSTEIHQKQISQPTTYITEQGLQNSSAKIAPEGSVVIALAGQGKTRGTVGYLLKSMALNQSLAALVTNEKCDSSFLYFKIDSMYQSLREISSGDGGRGGLNKKLINAVEICVPSNIVEQQAIANALSAFDTYISDLAELIEKKRNIRDGALEDLVSGRTRLDGFSGEWNEVLLNEFADINPRTDLPMSFQYVDLESVKGIQMVISRKETIKTAPSRAKRYATKGDVFFQTVRPYQKNNYYFDLDGEYVFSTGYAQLRTRNDAKFLFLLIRRDDFVRKVLDKCTGTSYPAINPRHLAEIPVFVPTDIEEQHAIANVLTAMDEEISALEAEREKMIQIREGAMDDLLTGRVRLKV